MNFLYQVDYSFIVTQIVVMLINIYMGVSVYNRPLENLAPKCVLCVFVCVISTQEY